MIKNNYNRVMMCHNKNNYNTHFELYFQNFNCDIRIYYNYLRKKNS